MVALLERAHVQEREDNDQLLYADPPNTACSTSMYRTEGPSDVLHCVVHRTMPRQSAAASKEDGQALLPGPVYRLSPDHANTVPSVAAESVCERFDHREVRE